MTTSGSGLSLTSGNWYTAKVVDDDDWSAGYVGLYKGNDTTVHQWDDFQVGFDNNGDGDIADAGDDILVSDDFNSNQVSLSYDNNGNLTGDGVYEFEYDAWNRLRKTILTDGSDETTIGEYEYYADNRRSKKTVSNRGPEVVENDGGNTTVLFYYCGLSPSSLRGSVASSLRWSICETRNGSNQTTFQHLWGTRYIDELIWLEKNGDPTESNDTDPDEQSGESTADRRYFVHQDRNWNVVALSEYDTGGTNNGRIVERYSYTPYGSFVVLKGDSGNGELNAVSLNSTVGNPFAHQGLAMDQEKESYQNRHRKYPARLQRFAQRDPLLQGPGVEWYLSEGVNSYRYVNSSPLRFTDPTDLNWKGCYCPCLWTSGPCYGCPTFGLWCRNCRKTCPLKICYYGPCPGNQNRYWVKQQPCWCPSCPLSTPGKPCHVWGAWPGGPRFMGNYAACPATAPNWGGGGGEGGTALPGVPGG